MSEGMNNREDVITFLTRQHAEIRALFDEVSTSTGHQRADAFDRLRRLLAVHETAEEQVVHPRARKEIPDGDSVVDARLREEHDGKVALAALEDYDLDSTEFETGLRNLQGDVLAHADAEERLEFPQLAEQLDDSQLERMRTAARLAESTAPTHPHPGVESATANTLAGPFASMLDRARDLITGSR